MPRRRHSPTPPLGSADNPWPLSRVSYGRPSAECQGSSGSLEHTTALPTPHGVHAQLFDPGGMVHARPVRHNLAAFRFLNNVGSRKAVISGLNHSAYTLAVNASQRRLPGHHARLASGRWPTFTGWDWLPTGSLRTISERISLSIHSMSPGLPGALRTDPIHSKPPCLLPGLLPSPLPIATIGHRWPCHSSSGRNTPVWRFPVFVTCFICFTRCILRVFGYFLRCNNIRSFKSNLRVIHDTKWQDNL